MRRPRPHAALVAAWILGAVAASAQVFPVLEGDPVDAFGRARFILPGVPLITQNDDGDFNPPVIDPDTIGDVDLVVRAGTLSPGASMPPPALVPPVAAAGGMRFPGGIDLPFTVIASDGDPLVPGGRPLLGPELDGTPVLVIAFADLDGDGFVGPTNADAAGATDNGREMQEASFPVGVRVAYFTGGVAHGVIATDLGAPQAAGGLSVLLTAAAYVGQFSPDFFLGTVPDGPGIATLLPFFPRLDPERMIDTDGSAGPALPNGRIGVELEDEFAPPVDHPVLGTPFALPTDGTSVSIDRASVLGGTPSRLRFVRPSSAVGLTGEEPRLAVRPGADGTLVEPLTEITVVDDGPGNGVEARLVPSDVLDNVSDPVGAVVARLAASPGLRIAEPDTDADPSTEPLAVGDAAGVVITVDDGAGANDSGATGTITVEMAAVPVERLTVVLSGGPPPVGTAPTVAHASLVERPAGFSIACPAEKTLLAVVTDPDDDASTVTATIALDGTPLGTVDLVASPLPPPGGAPPGAVFAAGFSLPQSVTVPGTLSATLVARDAAALASAPLVLDVPVVEAAAPEVFDVAVSPPTLPARVRTRVTVRATVADDCRVRRVTARRERRRGFGRLVRLNDRGKRGDTTPADGVFTGMRKLRAPSAGGVSIRVDATSRSRQTGTSEVVTVPVVP